MLKAESEVPWIWARAFMKLFLLRNEREWSMTALSVKMFQMNMLHGTARVLL